MKYFVYGSKEVDYLKKRDARLGAAIDEIGPIKRPITPDPFTSLVGSIVNQQISNKAAATVRGRLLNLVGEITPQNIASKSLEEIQGCGMSQRKAGYIKGIAAAALSGQVDFARLRDMQDQEVIKVLTSLRGVGVWTAEMLLINSLCRPDIVSYRDLAIRRGMMRLYDLEELPRKTFDYYRQRYSPYGSVASLYLWALSV
ncbi:MAG: DNA-3-methyladenine glycosylase 2 family protein [Firmicutes bacterium]|nr:DNA-3-methyladenine glycosylase 2 family protein [Bacillota bacterium]